MAAPSEVLKIVRDRIAAIPDEKVRLDARIAQDQSEIDERTDQVSNIQAGITDLETAKTRRQNRRDSLDDEEAALVAFEAANS
jgi:chromosome segregation ATPase